MTQPFRNKSFRIAFIVTMAFWAVGFLLLVAGLADYGMALFILLPTVVGVVTGYLPEWGNAVGGHALGLALFVGFLLVAKLEGVVCVVMALPLLALCFLVGFGLARFIQWLRNPPSDPKLHISFLPLLLFLAAAPLEKAIRTDKEQVISVSTGIVLPYTALEVYGAIKSVDTLDVPDKPFLMRIGLPIPQKCVLEKEAVGGLRTCYFKGGTIQERITALEPGRILRMDVVRYELEGRHWLGFKEAIYTFEDLGPRSCRMVRTTTYTSVLSPRMYWEPLERIGVEQEHAYVFENLKQDLAQGKEKAR